MILFIVFRQKALSYVKLEPTIHRPPILDTSSLGNEGNLERRRSPWNPDVIFKTKK